MQRLYCINNKPIPGAGNNPERLNLIKEGKEYEGELRGVKGSSMIAWCIPSISETEGYVLERFIALPGTTADVMEEVEKEGIANLETV